MLRIDANRWRRGADGSATRTRNFTNSHHKHTAKCVPSGVTHEKRMERYMEDQHGPCTRMARFPGVLNVSTFVVRRLFSSTLNATTSSRSTPRFQGRSVAHGRNKAHLNMAHVYHMWIYVLLFDCADACRSQCSDRRGDLAQQSHRYPACVDEECHGLSAMSLLSDDIPVYR